MNKREAGKPERDNKIAGHACKKCSGRIGRSADAKAFGAQAHALAVRAPVHHRHTGYDQLLADGVERAYARATVVAAVDEVLR